MRWITIQTRRKEIKKEIKKKTKRTKNKNKNLMIVKWILMMKMIHNLKQINNYMSLLPKN